MQAAATVPAGAPPRTLGLALWAGVFGLLLASGGLKTITGDARQMCDAARSLVRNGSLELRGSERSDVVRAADGRHYTKYPLLSIVGCVPALGLQDAGRALSGRDSAAERFLVGVWPSAIAATTALGLYLFALQLGLSAARGALGAFLLVFTTPLWSYARSLYSENLQALLVMWTMLVWLGAGAHPSRRRLIAGGLLLGLAINLKSLLIVLPLAVALDRLPLRPWSRVVGYTALGALPGVLAFLLYNRLRYGSLFALGYDIGRDGSIGFGTPLLAGLHGLLLSPGKSVFLYAPLLLLAIGGSRSMARARPREFRALALPVVLTVLAVSRWWAWSGDVAWGPRLLVPVLPLAFVPVLFGMPRRGAWRRSAFAALCALGVYAAFLGVALRPFQYVAVAQAAVHTTLGGRQSAPIRDDLVTLHYVPELSPLVGHHWLLQRAIRGTTDWDEASEYPWRSLGIQAWRPRENPGPRYLNFWFTPGGSPALAGLDALLVALSLAWLWRLRRWLAPGATRAPS